MFKHAIMILATCCTTGCQANMSTVQPPPSPKTIHVDIIKFQFTPAEVTINKGDTIIWINKEKRQYHSVWFEQSGEPEPDYFFPGETFSRTFEQVGHFPYRCGPHPKMTGKVIVN